MIWEKKGQIFNPAGHYKWMNSHAQVPTPVEFPDYLRVYFVTREDYDADGQCRSRGAFVDLDKSDFTRIIRISEKPVLELGGIGEFDEFGSMPCTVLKIDNVYYLYYTGWTRSVSTPHKEAIGLAQSRDGELFKKVGPGPIIADTLWEPYLHNGPRVYKYNGIYHMFYATGVRWLEGSDRRETQYVIRHATSKDGFNWNKCNEDVIKEKVEFECQNCPTILYIDGVYHMIFCYRYGLDFRNNKERGYKMGYAVSTDLVNWKRIDEEVGITLSNSGWDSEMMSYPCTIEIGGKIYMFYCGNQFGKEGFGYAELVHLTSQPGGAELDK